MKENRYSLLRLMCTAFVSVLCTSSVMAEAIDTGGEADGEVDFVEDVEGLMQGGVWYPFHICVNSEGEPACGEREEPAFPESGCVPCEISHTAYLSNEVLPVDGSNENGRQTEPLTAQTEFLTAGLWKWVKRLFGRAPKKVKRPPNTPEPTPPRPKTNKEIMKACVSQCAFDENTHECIRFATDDCPDRLSWCSTFEWCCIHHCKEYMRGRSPTIIPPCGMMGKDICQITRPLPVW